MEIQNGGQATLALATLCKWMEDATPEELEKVKAYVNEKLDSVEEPEVFLYSGLWSYLTDKGA